MEPADPERSVPNPAVTEKKRELGQVTAREGRTGLRAAGTRTRTVRGCTISHAELGRTIKNLSWPAGNCTLSSPHSPLVRETMNGEPIVRLERERKIITAMVASAPRRNWPTW